MDHPAQAQQHAVIMHHASEGRTAGMDVSGSERVRCDVVGVGVVGIGVSEDSGAVSTSTSRHHIQRMYTVCERARACGWCARANGVQGAGVQTGNMAPLCPSFLLFLPAVCSSSMFRALLSFRMLCEREIVAMIEYVVSVYVVRKCDFGRRPPSSVSYIV